jgi:hypothetical protein
MGDGPRALTPGWGGYGDGYDGFNVGGGICGGIAYGDCWGGGGPLNWKLKILTFLLDFIGNECGLPTVTLVHIILVIVGRHFQGFVVATTSSVRAATATLLWRVGRHVTCKSSERNKQAITLTVLNPKGGHK